MSAKNKRKHRRVKPKKSVAAIIDWRSKGSNFSSAANALVLQESFGGCGLVTTPSPKIKIDRLCRVKIGTKKPIQAQIKWVILLDPDVIKIGLEYLID